MARKEKLDQAAEIKRKYDLQRQYLDNQLKSKHEDASKNELRLRENDQQDMAKLKNEIIKEKVQEKQKTEAIRNH